MLHCKVDVIQALSFFFISHFCTRNLLAEQKVIKSIKIDNKLFVVHVSKMLCLSFKDDNYLVVTYSELTVFLTHHC